MAMTAESLRAPLLFVIDIGNGLIQQPIRPQLMKGDKKANTIIVRVIDGNEPVDLTGATVTCSFISPVKSAEILLTGSVSGNEASVTLADECYAEDGYFEANVKLTVGETARTILSITGNVLSKGSGVVIDIGNVIPSIDDIIAQYAAMKQAVEDANAARDAANTAAGNAENAATNANNAAAKIDGMTVSAVSGTSAAVSISEQNGAKHISFTLPKGDKGDKGDQGKPGKDGTGSGTVTGVKIGDETYAPDDAGVVDMSGMTAPDAAQLNGKDAKYYLGARNLLDNFDFTNPVNQRGAVSGMGGYLIDRWLSLNVGDSTPITVSSEGIVLPTDTSYIQQRIPLGVIDTAKTYTLAYKLAGEETPVVGHTVKTSSDFNYVDIWPKKACTIEWAALYEGEYTAENLPPYVPKGYAVELAECQRYYLPVNSVPLGTGYTSGNKAYISIPVPVVMRKTPNVVVETTNFRIIANGTRYDASSIDDIAIINSGSNGITISVSAETGGATTVCCAYCDAVYLDADL